jgi:hypothetical protein
VEPLVFKCQAPRISERHLHSGFEDFLKSRIRLVILLPGFHRDQPAQFLAWYRSIAIVEMEQIPDFKALIRPAGSDIVPGTSQIKSPVEVLHRPIVFIKDHPYALIGPPLAPGASRALDGAFHEAVRISACADAFDLDQFPVVGKCGEVVP